MGAPAYLKDIIIRLHLSKRLKKIEQEFSYLTI